MQFKLYFQNVALISISMYLANNCKTAIMFQMKMRKYEYHASFESFLIISDTPKDSKY